MNELEGNRALAHVQMSTESSRTETQEASLPRSEFVIARSETLRGNQSEDRHLFVMRQIGNLVEYFTALLVSLVAHLITVMLFPSERALALLLAFSVWTLFYLQRGVRLAILYWNLADPESKTRVRNSLISISFLLTFFLLLSLRINQAPYLNAYIVCIPLFVSFALNFILMAESYNCCFTFLQIVRVSISLVRLLTFFMVLFKSDKIASFSWMLALW